MKRIFYLLLLTFAGCLTKKPDKIAVCMENTSDVYSVINVKTFINGKFYKVIPVKRDTTLIHFENLIVDLPVKVDSINLMFDISETKDSTSCVVDRKKWQDGSWVHVHFSEVVFEKGHEYFGQVLSRDSIVHRAFYAEIIPKGPIAF